MEIETIVFIQMFMQKNIARKKREQRKKYTYELLSIELQNFETGLTFITGVKNYMQLNPIIKN